MQLQIFLLDAQPCFMVFTAPVVMEFYHLTDVSDTISFNSMYLGASFLILGHLSPLLCFAYELLLILYNSYA